MRYPILTVCQAKVDSMHYTLHWHPRREVNSTVEWRRSRWWQRYQLFRWLFLTCLLVGRLQCNYRSDDAAAAAAANTDDPETANKIEIGAGHRNRVVLEMG